MRWLYIIIISLSIVSCGSTTQLETSQTTTAKDSVVVSERIIVRQGVNLETVVEQPCDSVGILKPFKQTLKAKDISISLSNEDGNVVARIESDSLVSSSREVLKKTELESISTREEVKIKYKYPKWLIWSAIFLYIYVAYRVARIFYLPLRVLPY